MNIEQLVKKYTKDELIKKCKEKNIATNGSKSDLAKRMLSTTKNVIYKITKNNYGNYVHNETNLVFDKYSKKVIGYQMQNGSIRTLNRNDIETCKKYNFLFEIPTCLDPSPIVEIFENSDNDCASQYSQDSEMEEEEESD
jgi:hypothetical protein